MSRHKVSKGRSASKFRRQVKTVKAVNLRRPGRGGFRL